jgi:osmotically-inducible protein OsmY
MRKFHAATFGALVLAGWLGTPGAGYAQAPATVPSADSIEEAIDNRWEADATLKACKGCDLDVEVVDGVAKISGEVPSAALKARAARLANVKGVARVDNTIEVVAYKPASESAREGANKAANKTAEGVSKAADKTAEGVSKAAEKTGEAVATTGSVIDDAWITSKVKTQLTTADEVPASSINVDTKGNVVTLTGTVPTAAAHAAALRIARETKGVKRVVDNLKVTPKT